MRDIGNQLRESLSTDDLNKFGELSKLNLCVFKQGCPKSLWISSSTQLGEHPNFGLNAEEGFP